MVLFSDKEAQPLRVKEPVVVEPVVSQAAPEEACIREPVREEPVITPASSTFVGRVVGGFLSATAHMVTLLIRIGISVVTLPFRIGRFLWGNFYRMKLN